MSVTAYTVLRVSSTATHDELRRAYHSRVREYHPDRGGDAKKIALVNKAWEKVGTPEERAKYDRHLAELARAQEPSPRTPAPAAGIDPALTARAELAGEKATAVVKAAREFFDLLKGAP